MNTLKNTSHAPRIVYQPDQSVIKISGVSILENAPAYFEPVFAMATKFLEENNSLEVVFHLEYFNTGTSVCFKVLLDSIHRHKHDKPVQIKWRYDKEDQEIMENGQAIEELTGLEFIYEAV